MGLGDLYQEYHDRVKFLMIYIREAHPVDGWWLGEGIAGKMVGRYTPLAATDVHDPQTLQERRAVAGQCASALQYGIRTYVDDMDDTVSKAYAARPTRLYLVGRDGLVVYAGGIGPFGFHPEELQKAIEELLAPKNGGGA